MIEFIKKLFDSTGFMPRRYCGTWTTGEILLQNISDAVIWLSYMAIPVVLIYFVRKKRGQLPFPKMFWMFGAFIILCGITHFMDIVMFYDPLYRLAGVFKAMTAVVSLFTAITLVPLVPKALTMRTTEELEREIVERKRAEESLRESKERLHHLVSANPAVIYSLKFENGALKPTWISENITRLTGHKAEEIFAPNWWRDRLHPDDRERIVTEHAAPFPHDHLLTEYRFQRKDGDYLWVRDEKTLLRDAAGKPIEVVGSWANITERKRAEGHLFQSQKMETVGKLAGGIAHEFNSIMTAIIGQSEMMLGDLPAGNPLCKNAQEIRQAADRAAMLTRQLLAYGRKQILQPKILDLNTLIAEMEGMLRHLMGDDVDVRIVRSVGLKPAKIDAGQVEQVVMNIAMNAADAMPNGGKLTLETANVTLNEEYVRGFPDLKAGEYVMLAISDTGAGMSEEVKARLFEPFFTTKGVGKGTGLGLATCHGIIKQSGGHIAVYSESGRGTTFKIYLPQAEQPTNVLTARRDPGDLPRGTEAILVVEDDPALREMSSALLRRLGYTVLAASNGVEALNLTHQPGTGHIDLLFTDVVMPQMSGKELSNRIHALHPDTKILFASAYTESAIVHQGVLDEGVVLLQKPFTPSALALKLREVLDDRS